MECTCTQLLDYWYIKEGLRPDLIDINKTTMDDQSICQQGGKGQQWRDQMYQKCSRRKLFHK
jgi:hypothetical protein